MMFHLSYYNILCVFLIGCIVHVHSSSVIDIRIDHHKVDTTRDLIINTPRPRFSWKIRVSNDRLERNVQQIAYQIQIQSIQLTQRDQPFQLDTGRIASSQSIHVPYAGENDLLPSTYYRFRLRIWTTDSNEASQWIDWIQFRTPIFNLHEYLTLNSSAAWIGSTEINMNELRKEFTVPNASPIKSAIVYISGIGYYELYLNGNKVDLSRKLDPGWTPYERRTLIVSFDLTPNITVGANAVGVKLGNGWYTREQYGLSIYGPPRLLFDLTITFENGEILNIVSNQTWTGREGAIKRDSVYNGELCDGRYKRQNWTFPGFNDPFTPWIMSDILPSLVNYSLNGSLVLQDMPPVRAGLDALHFEVDINDEQQGYLNKKDIGEIQGAKLTDGGVLKPIDMWISNATVVTFDIGQNMAGWCRLKFTGVRGYGVYIRQGEILTLPTIANDYPTRDIYTDNLRRAAAIDTYVLDGSLYGEVYEPTFTYHGFRYLAVLNPPSSMKIDDVECPVVHSETTLKGHFSSSNPIINQIQHNILWSQLSNVMSLPTDCPQRNERFGWMGDAALTVNEALYNFDLIKLYQNYLNSISAVQRNDGAVPNYVPGYFYPAESNWGTALPTITWQVYRHYNDIQTLQVYYPHVLAYVEYLRDVYNTTGLINYPFRSGDWVPPPPYNQTNKHLISSFAFLHDVDLLINMSQILGKTNETEMYSEFYKQLANEFHQVFYNNSENYYADGMQSAQILALALRNVVPNNVRQSVLHQLVNDINEKGIHITTGIVSTAQIYPVLSDNGYHDLAVQLVSSITYPSHGYMFNNPYENATTVWELWNAPFTGPNMNSRNHIMYGSVGAWFYSHLAGIDHSSNMITIRPRMVSESKKDLMSKLDCQLNTLYGMVRVSYTRHENDIASNSILMKVTIPANTQGRIMFEPLFAGGQCKRLMESSKMIWSLDGNATEMKGFSIEKDLTTGLMIVHVGSGEYEFQATWE